MGEVFEAFWERNDGSRFREIANKLMRANCFGGTNKIRGAASIKEARTSRGTFFSEDLLFFLLRLRT